MKGMMSQQHIGPSVKVITIEGNTIIHPLKIGINTFGRVSEDATLRTDVDIDTNDKKMSRRHCAIKYEIVNGVTRLSLFDTNSSYGTFLKDYHLEPISKYDVVYLSHGDMITIGETKLLVEVPLTCEIIDVMKSSNGPVKGKTTIIIR